MRHGLDPEAFGRIALHEMRAHLGEDREDRALGEAIQGVDLWWRLDFVDAVLVEHVLHGVGQELPGTVR